MQVGELVELSSAGRQLQQNEKVRGLIGLVTRIDTTSSTNHPIKIEWLGYGHYPMKRYEIKRVRATR
jgi:hypothetical protein